jgi:hypothetical protein
MSRILLLLKRERQTKSLKSCCLSRVFLSKMRGNQISKFRVGVKFRVRIRTQISRGSYSLIWLCKCLFLTRVSAMPYSRSAPFLPRCFRERHKLRTGEDDEEKRRSRI